MPFKGRRRADALAGLVNGLQRGETGRIFGARRNPEADGAAGGGRGHGHDDGDEGDRGRSHRELLTIRWPQLGLSLLQTPLLQPSQPKDGVKCSAMECLIVNKSIVEPAKPSQVDELRRPKFTPSCSPLDSVAECGARPSGSLALGLLHFPTLTAARADNAHSEFYSVLLLLPFLSL